MTGTGNDIVSLNAISITRTNDYKFYSKILSDSEIPLYNEFGLTGIPFEVFVWLLWSIKESAYKFLQRHDSGLIFTPVKFEVQSIGLPPGYTATNFNAKTEGTGFDDLPSIKGIVNFKSYSLYAYSLVYNELIATVVTNENNSQKTCWGIKSIDNSDIENQSKEARLILLNRLHKLHNDCDFAIAKNQHGCPILLKDSIESVIPISLAHHGRFVAYSFYDI